MKKSIWRHKKYGKRNYEGRYTHVSGERIFFLTGYVQLKVKKLKLVGRIHNVTFESPQAAKALGWKKLK